MLGHHFVTSLFFSLRLSWCDNTEFSRMTKNGKNSADISTSWKWFSCHYEYWQSCCWVFPFFLNKCAKTRKFKELLKYTNLSNQKVYCNSVAVTLFFKKSEEIFYTNIISSHFLFTYYFYLLCIRDSQKNLFLKKNHIQKKTLCMGKI